MAKTSKGMTAGSYRSVGKTYDGVTIVAPKLKPSSFTAKQLRSTIAEVVGNVSVEQRPDGAYAVRREPTQRASAIAPTRQDAVASGREPTSEKRPGTRKAGGPDKRHEV